MICNPAHEAWVQRAREHDLLSAAMQFGARLRRVGAEHIGPCPFCHGTDRFSINPSRQLWNCRGFGGGRDAIGLAMHVGGLAFHQACEALTGEPSPGRTSRPMSEAERRAIEDRRRRAEAERAAREERAAAYRAGRALKASDVLASCRPIAGTLAETYLHARGIPTPPMGWPSCLTFASSLYYELDGAGRSYPALVARVDDCAGELAAVWRIYLSPDGQRKAEVEAPKVGLGPAGGGAVRLGGIGPRIGVCEGIETALAAWALTGYRYPIWATLSTSGMAGLDLPIEVERVSIFPDGDRSCRLQNGEYVACEPAGRRAAKALRDRLAPAGIRVTIEQEPAAGTDYLDVFVKSRGMEAA